MPAIIEMRLKPERPYQVTTRQLHGLACTLFVGSSSAGHAGQEKPFAIWPLRPDPDAPAAGWLWRIAWLRAGLPQTVLAACGQVRLGPVTCAVTDVTYQAASHADLAAPLPDGRVQVTFHSPSYFSQDGADVLQPDPRLIAGSWRRRWNAHAPAGEGLLVGDESWLELFPSIRPTAFDLRTEQMDSGRGHRRTGFTGTMTLRLDPEVPPVLEVMFGALVRFAAFCGTGAQTTHGFGATSALIR